MPRSAFTRAFPETICRDFGQQTTDGFCKNAAREPLVTFLSRNEILVLRRVAVFLRMKPITIVGGGLAGLTLGIGLRQRGIPVTIWEAGHYPRHRVCGEFIVGRGQDVLARLGLSKVFFQTGAITARTAAFFLGRTRCPVRTLTPPALCLSRF